ncbi:MAG: hypothetical protein FJ006_11935 [Chloroflexi bacterium]|nr:hypothetical protein [Chloroflexota bacterium]
MTVNRAALQKALETVSPVVGSNGNGSVSEHFYFKTDTIVGTNFDSYVSAKFDSGIKCAVNSKKLLPFVKSLTSDNVSLSLDKDVLTVGFGKVKAKFPTTDFDSPWPSMDDAEFKPFPFDKERLNACYTVCSQFVTTDETRRVLMGVNVVSTPNGTFMQATDGRRLARLKVADTIEDMEELLLFPSFLALMKNEEIASFAVSKSFVAYTCKSGNIYAGRRLEGLYPNTVQVIPNTDTDEYSKVAFPETVIEHIRRAMIVSPESAKFEITEDSCTITCQADGNEFTETIPVAASKAVSVIYNLKYLLPILKANTTMYIAATGPGMINYMDGVMVLMPLRLS